VSVRKREGKEVFIAIFDEKEGDIFVPAIAALAFISAFNMVPSFTPPVLTCVSAIYPASNASTLAVSSFTAATNNGTICALSTF